MQSGLFVSALFSTALVAPAAAGAVYPGLGTPPPSAVRAECIYMVKKWDDGYLQLRVWSRKGRNIRGIRTAIPSDEWVEVRGKIVGRKLKGQRREQQVSGYVTDWEKASYTLVGRGPTLRVKGYQRITADRMRQLTDGWLGDGNHNGC